MDEKQLKIDCGKKSLFFTIDEKGRLLQSGFFREGSIPDKPDKKYFTPVEIEISGKNPDSHHGMRHVGGCLPEELIYQDYVVNGEEVILSLKSQSLSVKLHYRFYGELPVVRSYTEVTNLSGEALGLEYVSSFCLYDFPMEKVWIPHSDWCKELRWQGYAPEELGVYKRIGDCTKRISISNTGTWSCKEYFPIGCIEGGGQSIFWQIEQNGSWNWEIGYIAGTRYLKLSGPSERENAWWKELKQGETFESVKTAVCITDGGLDEALAGMTRYRRQIAYRGQADLYLPIIFNDYAGCLNADPTTEKELPVIDAAAKTGAEIYCMDAGWYAQGDWWDSVGEWKPCKDRFPNGMGKVFDKIREKGMIPGIWLEPESFGIHCPIVDRFDDDCFFMRHGKRVIDHGRYQFDFRHPKVRAFLDEVTDRLIADYGIGYFKFDYNIEAGSGTERNADSFGDGLMGHNKAYLSWIDSLQARHPDLIIESCASGGMRTDYAMLSHFSLQSLTDGGDMENVSWLAASSASSILPEQAAVWVLPEKEYTLGEIAVYMVSALFQRIHLSGKTPWLFEEQMALIQEGVEFYKSVRTQIPSMVPFLPLGLTCRQKEWIVRGYAGEAGSYLTVVRLKKQDGQESQEEQESRKGQKNQESQEGLGADVLEITLPGNFTQAQVVYPIEADCQLKLCEETGECKEVEAGLDGCNRTTCGTGTEADRTACSRLWIKLPENCAVAIRLK